MKVGIIAEDDSDVAVLRVITTKLLRPKTVGFKSIISHGCGKLRRKCDSWAVNLVNRGCPYIVLVHDLDDYGEQYLRETLTKAIAPAKAKVWVVLIPKREIEAWLLYDADAIAAAFEESSRLKLPGNPEALPDPKKKLGDLVWTKYRKRYLNTVHNARIAEHLDVSFLAAKSKSFSPHPEFAIKVKALLKS